MCSAKSFDPAAVNFNQYDTDTISRQDKKHFLHPWQIFDTPADEGALPIAAANGLYLYDTDGKKYLDAVGGLWCTNIGLGREEMADAIADQVRQMAYASPFVDMTNIPAATLAAKLAEIAPGDIDHVIFSCGGSTAIDSAYRLIQYYQNCRGKHRKSMLFRGTIPTTAPPTRRCQLAEKRAITRLSSTLSPTRFITSPALTITAQSPV